ncbi:hypothetical protein BH24DEI2_BH24DEI2_24110 [soil metagenome]
MNLPEWLLQLSALLAGAVLLGVLAKRVRLPLTVVLAVVGFGAGAFLHNPLQGEVFKEVVVFLFLPVLVFEAALGLSTRAFFNNLLPILVLAVPALIVSACVVGAALVVGLGVPVAAAGVFGVLISATDPVAVVAVFRKLRVPRRPLNLIEGESLLNDGVAIVLVNIFPAAALGGRVSVGEGVLDFLLVFFGGTAVGVGVGGVAAFVLPWLEKLPAAALSVAVAYGGFVLADEVFGFSGIMATLTAGLVLSAAAPVRASAEVRIGWTELWEALGYVANALLFLIIGLAIEPALLLRYGGAIALAVAAVLVARALGVVPLVWVLERLGYIPPVGWRNEAVLVWGGLRGGVALALALALPETLPQRDLFIAMTGGVVLTTLLLNATTISALVHRLGLDEPSRADRFLAGGARLAGISAAREQLSSLGLDDPTVTTQLNSAEQEARTALENIDLSDAEEIEVVTRRGLFVEHETYQSLSDAGLLPDTVARTLLNEVADQVERVTLGEGDLSARERERSRFAHLLEGLKTLLRIIPRGDPAELAYTEASARRLAARRTCETLQLFRELPNIDPASVETVHATFEQWERQAVEKIADLDNRSDDAQRLRRRQAEILCHVAAKTTLEDLADLGLLPERVAREAAQTLAAEVDEKAEKPADATVEATNKEPKDPLES